MSELLIGTQSGVFRLGNDENLQHEEGPATVAFLTRAHEGVVALTQQGALWRRTSSNVWKLVHEHPVAEDVWACGADPRVPGRLYLGVSPALLYWSDDGGASWMACEAIRRIPGYERWTFPPPPHIPHVRSVVPDPQVIGAVYIGVEEGGIYRTGDQGETWESLNEGLYWDVHTVTPASAGLRLYATTGRGFYRSDDGGQHWRHLMDGLERRSWRRSRGRTGSTPPLRLGRLRAGARAPTRPCIAATTAVSTGCAWSGACPRSLT
jgi:hypothetical protein